MNRALNLVMQVLLGIMLVGVLSNPTFSSSLVNSHSSHSLRFMQEDTIDDIPPVVYFVSPSDEDTVDYGTIELEFYVYDDVAISYVSLTVGNEIFNLTGKDSPYEWEPRRDGWFFLTLFCHDSSENFASDTIRLRVAVIQIIPPVTIIPVAIGLIALCSILYKYRFENSPEWHEDPDYASTLTVPLHYMVRSRIFGREPDSEER